MSCKRVRHRFQQALPTLWAAFACADVIAEATRRELGATAAADPGLAEGSRRMFVLFGRNLLRQLRNLLAVDERYQELRARQRRYQARRDRIAKRLYRELADARRFFKGLFGYDEACEYLGLKGPTAREPWALFHQVDHAVHRAKSQEPPEGRYFGKRKDKAKQVVAGLEALCKELDAAIDDVVRGRTEVDAAMLFQRQAMKEFDRVWKESARVMEAQLIGVGLPTLGDAVRPAVGRRGRPLKKRPVDLYPDLVARVRAEGLMALDVASEKRVAVERITVKATEDETAAASAKAAAEVADALDDGKEADRAGDVFSRLILPPPVAACSLRRPRHELTAGRRGDTVERRPEGPAPGASRIRRIRKVASAWWVRLRQVA